MHRFLTVLCIIIVSSSADDDLVVRIEDGNIQGTSGTNLDGETIYSFYGIPYAKPPINDLRFKDPLPSESWIGTFDGSKVGKCCIQQGTMGSEDCLNINVHIKELNPTELKPVMVWIHGGAFLRGCNQFYGPEFLLIEDIIFVTINYRLGILGFFNIENSTLGVPGNAGLKDQALALKWVQKNIIHFGGDPNKVTIFGESAGSVSVHYHIVSEASRGLFQQAIIQSGTVVNPWASVDRQLAIKFGNFLKLDYNNEEELLKLLRDFSATEIYEKQELFLKGMPPVVGPIVENPNENQFIIESGFEILKCGNYNKVPVMIGYCSNEGLLFATEKLDVIVTDTILQGQEIHMEALNPLQISLHMNQSVSSEIQRELIDIYFRGINADNKYLLASDYSFINGILKSAELHANTSQYPVYLYKMTLDAGRNFLKRTRHLDDFPGVCHADDLGYLFNMEGLEMEMGEQEIQYIRTFVKLWTNFAKYGNPTPNVTDFGIEWKPVDENQYYIDIGEKLSLKNKPEEERASVWKKIYSDVLDTKKCATS